MKTFYSSDYHLGHWNIARYCNRPFKTLEDMDEAIICNHNSRVKPGDILYHIGDFAFRNTPGGKEGEGTVTRSQEYEKRLNGKIIHVRGNHDRQNSTKTIIESIHIYTHTKNILLIHKIDGLCYDDVKKYDFVLCGHVHNNWAHKFIYRDMSRKDRVPVINVGVDVHKFHPVTMEEIISEYSRMLKETI